VRVSGVVRVGRHNDGIQSTYPLNQTDMASDVYGGGHKSGIMCVNYFGEIAR